MKKLLTLLGSFILGINSSIIVVGCDNNSVKTPKHEMTKANLDNFFATNNSFNYKGPSFFKDGVQTDNLNDINELMFNVLENIISNSIKEKIKNYFLLKENYIFNILPDNSDDSKNLAMIKTINFNGEKQYKFQIALYKNYPIEPDILYCSKWLIMSFTETTQYNAQEWLEAYKNFLILESSSIFNTIITKPGNSGIIGVKIKDQDWRKNPQLIKKYQDDNNSEVLNNIQNDINNSIELIKNPWQIYKENVFKINIVNSYKYISLDYYPEDETKIWSIIENVNITIAYDPTYSPYSYSETFNLNINCL